MTHYYYSSDGSVRSYDTAYSTTTTTYFSPTSYRKKRRKPIDDFPEKNEELDRFLGAFAQKGTNDGK